MEHWENAQVRRIFGEAHPARPHACFGRSSIAAALRLHAAHEVDQLSRFRPGRPVSRQRKSKHVFKPSRFRMSWTQYGPPAVTLPIPAPRCVPDASRQNSRTPNSGGRILYGVPVPLWSRTNCTNAGLSFVCVLHTRQPTPQPGHRHLRRISATPRWRPTNVTPRARVDRRQDRQVLPTRNTLVQRTRRRTPDHPPASVSKLVGSTNI